MRRRFISWHPFYGTYIVLGMFLVGTGGRYARLPPFHSLFQHALAGGLRYSGVTRR